MSANPPEAAQEPTAHALLKISPGDPLALQMFVTLCEQLCKPGGRNPARMVRAFAVSVVANDQLDEAVQRYRLSVVARPKVCGCIDCLWLPEVSASEVFGSLEQAVLYGFGTAIADDVQKRGAALAGAQFAKFEVATKRTYCVDDFRAAECCEAVLEQLRKVMPEVLAVPLGQQRKVETVADHNAPADSNLGEVTTKPVSEPTASPWWMREIYVMTVKDLNRRAEAEIWVAQGVVVDLRPAWFMGEFSNLIGSQVDSEPLLGELCQASAHGAVDSGDPVKWGYFPIRIERNNVGAPKWWQTEHFRIWFEQGSQESERAIEFKDGKVVALVPGWYAKAHAGLVGKALLAEPAVRKLLEVAGSDLQPPTWIERHVEHQPMKRVALVPQRELHPAEAETKPHARVDADDIADHAVPPVLPLCMKCHWCGCALDDSGAELFCPCPDCDFSGPTLNFEETRTKESA